MVLLVVNIESLACIEYSSMMFIPAKKSDVTNVTKDFGLDDDDTADNKSQVDIDRETGETRNTIESYTLKPPSVHDVVKQEEAEQETKDERIARKGKFAKALLNSSLSSSNHTLEKENQHHEKERKKNLYGYYNSGEDDLPFVTSLDL